MERVTSEVGYLGLRSVWWEKGARGDIREGVGNYMVGIDEVGFNALTDKSVRPARGGPGIRTMLGYAVQDPSVGMDLHMSRAVMSVKASRRQIRGDMREDACVNVACVHFYAVCSEYGDKHMVCRRV